LNLKLIKLLHLQSYQYLNMNKYCKKIILCLVVFLQSYQSIYCQTSLPQISVQKRSAMSLLRAAGVGVFIIGQAESSTGQIGVSTPDGFNRIPILPLTKYGWGMFSYIGVFSAQLFLNNIAYELSSPALHGIDILGPTTTFGYRIYHENQLRLDACLGTGTERLYIFSGINTGITQIQGSIAASYFIPFVSIPATDGGQPVQLGTLFNARLGYTHRLIYAAPPEVINRDLGPGVFLHFQIGLGMWSETEPPQPNL
jgi:hypothetical protein